MTGEAGEVGSQSPVVVTAAGPAAHRDDGHGELLVATPRGSMVHRSDCVIVADKHDLRTIDDIGDLVPCKLCEPLTAN